MNILNTLFHRRTVIHTTVLLVLFLLINGNVTAQESAEFELPQLEEEAFSEIERDEALELLTDFGLVTDIESLENGEQVESEDISCFDYYRFNSVQVPFTTIVDSTVPGAPMNFSGHIKNENNYPILNGSVYVKVFKLSDSDEKNTNGPDVVDQFFVKEDIVLPANAEIPIEFEWVVPAWAEGGMYRVSTFFVSQKKYNLLGLSFTDDVVGNSASFGVVSDREESVFLDKTSVTVNENQYSFAAYPPQVDRNEPVFITTEVVNTTSEDQVVPVTFNVYSWDAMQPFKNRINTEDRKVSVPAGSRRQITFTLYDTNHPVYLIETVLSYKDTSSILNIRLSREGIEKLRINFPSVASYPIVANKKVELFTCFHGMSDNEVSGEIILTLIDENGTEILTKKESDYFGGDMNVLVAEYTPEKTMKTFSLRAELFQDGELVDESILYYECDDFQNCDTQEKVDNESIEKTLYIIAGCIILLLTILLGKLVGVIISRSKTKEQ